MILDTCTLIPLSTHRASPIVAAPTALIVPITAFLVSSSALLVENIPKLPKTSIALLVGGLSVVTVPEGLFDFFTFFIPFVGARDTFVVLELLEDGSLVGDFGDLVDEFVGGDGSGDLVDFFEELESGDFLAPPESSLPWLLGILFIRRVVTLRIWVFLVFSVFEFVGFDNSFNFNSFPSEEAITATILRRSITISGDTFEFMIDIVLLRRIMGFGGL